MSTSLFFNLSFDLGGISLVLFVVWFFVNFHNSEAAFKWFSLSILALLASVIILSYGSIKLSNVRSTLPNQNQTEIANLKQEVSSLKGKKSRDSTSSNKAGSSDSSSNHKAKSSSSETEVPSRIVNSHDNQLLKKAVSKHEHHVTLVAKVLNSSQPSMVRGVHSSQDYELHNVHHKISVGEFLIIKGTATHDNGDTIKLTVDSVKRQPNS